MACADTLEKGIRDFVHGDIERPLGKRWRSDGKPSKHDKCVHGVWMYEECPGCADRHFEWVLVRSGLPGIRES